MLKLIITAYDKQPPDIQILARNKSTYEVCGYTEQDGYEVVEDIPSGFVQCALPPQYGTERLSLAQIKRNQALEGGALEATAQKVDEATAAIEALMEGLL